MRSVCCKKDALQYQSRVGSGFHRKGVSLAGGNVRQEGCLGTGRNLLLRNHTVPLQNGYRAVGKAFLAPGQGDVGGLSQRQIGRMQDGAGISRGGKQRFSSTIPWYS